MSPTNHRRRKRHKRKDKRPPGKDIPKRAQQQQAARVPGLHEGCNRRGALEADVKRLGDPVQNRLVVVEVRDGEA